MATPLDERARSRLLALIAAVTLTVLLLDLRFGGSVDTSVWVFVAALLLSGVWLGAWFGTRVQPSTVVSRASRRRTTYGVALALVLVVFVILRHALDVERTTVQDVLVVTGVGVATFVLTLSVSVLRRLPSSQPG